MIINKLIRIFLFAFVILFISCSLSFILDNTSFKALCNYGGQSEIKELGNNLSKINTGDFLYWITKFENLFGSPLIYAIYVGNIDVVELLINTCLKHNINYTKITSSSGMSILSVASYKEHNHIVDLLLQSYNINVCMDIRNRTSPLHEAAKKGNVNICKSLIKKIHGNILVHEKDIKQMTPINYLIEKKKENYVLELLEIFPVNINYIPINFNGWSYLHFAVYENMYYLCEYLLCKGFNPLQKDTNGITPKALTLNNKDNSILQLIKTKSKKPKCCLIFFRVKNIKLAAHFFNKNHGNYAYID